MVSEHRARRRQSNDRSEHNKCIPHLNTSKKSASCAVSRFVLARVNRPHKSQSIAELKGGQAWRARCCPSMIMSPFVLDRNGPLIGSPRGDQIGADRDEQEGVEASGSIGSSAGQTGAGRGCQSTATRELPAGEAAVEAISRRRSGGTAAPQRGAKLESRAR